MRYTLVSAALVAGASAHGLIRSVEGANGVSMPGLSVADGTPRDCSTNSCGSQADTSIIRDRQMGTSKASALGMTQGNGPVDAGKMIASFMGGANAASVPSNQGQSGAVGVEDDIRGVQQRREEHKRQIGNLLGGILGGGLGGGGGDKNNFAQETMVADMAGQGAAQGLPTADENGEVTMVYRQINQDGAGPLSAAVDSTSGGTDPSAFQNAKVTKDVPGLGIQGLSLATNTDFPLKVQMPQGMTCDGQAGGANNVCVVRVRNGAAAGPFGGSAAFTQTPAARKRAIAFRLKKRMEFNNREE